MPERRSCLVVIARDEAPRIERLLRSVSPWVDDMLVLDTGSTDATVAVARACGARTAHFAWCDDFAVARNAALALAAADWHVVLDADEWLIDGGPVLADLRQQPADFVGVLQRLDQEAAAGLVQDWISRVLPGSVRYTGRVHEQPQHALPTQRLAITIGHDGYSLENRAAKRGRNRALLQLELARWPGDAGLWFTLGNDHSAYDEAAQAAAAYARAEALRPADSPWRRELAARHLYALKRAGRHAEGLACAEARMADCADSPDFFFALGDLMLDWAAEDPSQGATALPLAEAAWLRCLELGERPDQPGSVQGRGSHLAAHNLAVVYEGLGDAERARALRERHPPPTR
jgi:hypothetical protein